MHSLIVTKIGKMFALVMKLSTPADMTVYAPACLPASGTDFTGKDTRVGIHRANFADFILDLRNCYTPLHLYVGFTHKYRVVESKLFIFCRKLFLVCLTAKKIVGNA
jgi:hypothetical protein